MSALSNCVVHQDRTALWDCPGCKLPFCADCARHTWAAKGFVDECPRCGAPLAEVRGARKQLEPEHPPAEPGTQAYLDRLGHFASYPFRHSVLITLVGLAAVNSLIAWCARYSFDPLVTGIGLVIMVGLEASTYFLMVKNTAYGHEELEFPDFSTMVDSILEPLARYLAALSPIVAAVVLYGVDHGSILGGFGVFLLAPAELFKDPSCGLLLGLGLLLLPLLTAVAALSERLRDVLNPAIWIHTLGILRATYLVGALAFYLVLAADWWLWIPLLATLREHFSIPLLTTFATAVLAYLPMALRARLLGGLIEPYFRD